MPPARPPLRRSDPTHVIRSRSSSGLVIVALATALGACGGAPPGATARVNGTRSADSANVAIQATEPRTGDVTASGPAPMHPTPGNTATVASGASSPAAPPAGAATGGAATAGAATEGASSTETGAKRDAPTKIGARHVLIQWMGSDRAAPSVVRSREQALSVAQEVLRRARNKEDFARLAIEFSDEPGAGGRGGSLGRFGRGQMVPAFEAAAFKLEVGQISDIVETPFGFHIIQRTE